MSSPATATVCPSLDTAKQLTAKPVSIVKSLRSSRYRRRANSQGGGRNQASSPLRSAISLNSDLARLNILASICEAASPILLRNAAAAASSARTAAMRSCRWAMRRCCCSRSAFSTAMPSCSRARASCSMAFLACRSASRALFSASNVCFSAFASFSLAIRSFSFASISASLARSAFSKATVRSRLIQTADTTDPTTMTPISANTSIRMPCRNLRRRRSCWTNGACSRWSGSSTDRPRS